MDPKLSSGVINSRGGMFVVLFLPVSIPSSQTSVGFIARVANEYTSPVHVLDMYKQISQIAVFDIAGRTLNWRDQFFRHDRYRDGVSFES